MERDPHATRPVEIGEGSRDDGRGVAAVLGIVVLISLLVLGYYYSEQRRLAGAEPPVEVRPLTPVPAGGQPEIKVYVVGEVREPQKVVSLPPGSRIEDAVKAAGGFTERADPLGINLAQRVEDGQMIEVPARPHLPTGEVPSGLAGEGGLPVEEETPPPRGGVAISGGAGIEAGEGEQGGDAYGSLGDDVMVTEPIRVRKVSVNYATVEELQRVPGLGPELASRIVEYRRRWGAFSTLEDLMKVPGIKEGKLEQIRPYIDL